MLLMNGFEFLEHLRAVPLIQPVRIVLLSSPVLPKDAREAGAFGVERVNKPTTIAKLQNLL